MTKTKMIALASIILCAGILVTTISYTQEAETNTDINKMSEAEAPDNSYLAKFHAQELVRKYMKDNLNSIYMLKVIVTNFSDKGWNSEYDALYNSYKKAMQHYYKREIIQARVDFEKNDRDIKNLLKKVIEQYKKDASQMLDECAEKVLMLHLDAATRSDPNRNDALHLNQLRLRVAYGQYDDAQRAVVEHYYKSAVYNLRVAKSYAIRILEDLASPDNRQAVMDKYKVHKADNLDRIYGSKQKQSGGQTTN